MIETENNNNANSEEEKSDAQNAFNFLKVVIDGLSYLNCKVTVSFLKSYRKRKQSKIILANMGELIRNMPDEEKITMPLEDLENIEDETIIAEYDEDRDQVVQADFVGDEGMDQNIEVALEQNGGMLIID